MVRNLHSLTPTDTDPKTVIERYAERLKDNDRVHLYTGAVIKSIEGYFGNFDVTLIQGDRKEKFKVGTIVVATGSEDWPGSRPLKARSGPKP